jgi:ethanolamine utilization microcompartment shell protein EutL
MVFSVVNTTQHGAPAGARRAGRNSTLKSADVEVRQYSKRAQAVERAGVVVCGGSCPEARRRCERLRAALASAMAEIGAAGGTIVILATSDVLPQAGH